MVIKTLLTVGALALCVSGCEKDKPSTATPPLDPNAASKPAPDVPDPEAPAHTPTAPGAGASAAGPSGKVLETMDSGGYTYARLDTGGAELWVAGPTTAIAVGEMVTVQGGTPMQNFRSNTLNRTFDTILFVEGFQKGGAAAAAGGGDPHAGLTKASPEVKVEKMEPPAGGKSIADVFAGKKDLAGKKVTVRGKVVKYNGGIMGRNWVHLRDGSGAAGTNDLTLTTQAQVKVGDVVVATGTLAVGKDFGGGYSYDVIVEDADIKAE